MPHPSSRPRTPRPRGGRALSAVLTLVLLVPLAACGDQREAYCSALEKDQAAIGEIINSTTPGALVTGLPTLRALAKKAPEDLTDEWQTFLNAVEGLSDALERADLRPSQVKGGLPAGLDATDKAAVSGAADVLASSDTLDAANGIETQARDVCKVNLGL